MFFKRKKPDYTFYVIDDVREQTKVIESILKNQFNAKVMLFHDPLKLLRTLKNASIAPDLIIADQKMPEMTGLKLRENIIDDGLNIPFIFITGAEGEEIIENDIIMLSKPINVRKLVHHIKILTAA